MDGFVCATVHLRRLPDSLLDPVLARPPRDGRALLRLVGVLGGIAQAESLVRIVRQKRAVQQTE